jgi:peptide-methionine (S)-S-oxide reductase
MMSPRAFLTFAALAFGSILPATRADTLVVGGGCFWCTEATFELLPGVTGVVSGYAGGTTENPKYKDLFQSNTGHAEVIQITYDPAKVTLDVLFTHFWKIHDPTQVGGQGADEGPQYRSIILYADPAQKAAAEKSLAEAAPRFRKPITTTIEPLTKFWPAEDYHQDYFAKNPSAGYCRVVIKPKVDKLKKELKPAS